MACVCALHDLHQDLQHLNPAHLAGYAQVKQTYSEYVALTDGDKSMALRFLEKKYTEQDIAGAAEWIGLD